MTPTVELIQDTVENVLMTHKINGVSYISVAKAYILYREEELLKLRFFMETVECTMDRARKIENSIIP